MTIQHKESAEIRNGVSHQEGECYCGEYHAPDVKKPEVRKKYAIVAVATGKGLINAFKEMGAEYIVSGGQSMNPSTEDFIRGFDMLNADNIIVFPNNGNIILAARQSAKIYTESKVHVVETKSLAQGFAALTMLDLNGEPEEILEDLKPTIENVTTGLIYSIRDTDINGIHIKDDYIALATTKSSLPEGVLRPSKRAEGCRHRRKGNHHHHSGEGVTQKEVNDLVKYIERNFSNLEIDVIEGNQEVYSYILAIE